MEVEGILECSHCGNPSVMYIVSFGQRYVWFWVNHHLEELGLHAKYPNLKIRKIVHQDRFDVSIRCPVCGAEGIRYNGTPLTYTIEDTTDDMVSIRFDDPLLKHFSVTQLSNNPEGV